MVRFLSVSTSTRAMFAMTSLAVVCALVACKNQTPAPAPVTDPTPGAAGAPTVVTAAAAADSAAAAPPPASKYSETGFDLALQPKGVYAPGQAAEAEIVLLAKAPFHVNEKYPYKFKIKEAPGLKFASLVVAKELVKLEPTRATLPVAFTPEAAGKHTLTGQLSFSVCTADQCMIEKRDLALEIEAK